MKPLRHASRLVTLIGLALACATANAALLVNVEGVRGSGVTTWTLSGSGTAVTPGIRYEIFVHQYYGWRELPVRRYGIGATHHRFRDANHHPHLFKPGQQARHIRYPT